MRRSAPSSSRKVDWAALNFAFVLVMALLSGAMTYAYLSGSTSERIASLERRIAHLEAGMWETGK